MNLTTTHLKLIPFSEDHITAIVTNNLPKLGELLGVETPDAWTAFDGAAEAVNFFYEMIRSQKGDTRFGSYFTTHTQDKKLIGTAGFKGKADYPHFVEIGYEVHPEYQQRGYATEVAQELIRFARSEGVKNIKAHTLAQMNASCKVLTKCGFKKRVK